MNWKIGQKLVCVKAGRGTKLIAGEIYEYAGPGHICNGDQLVDIINPAIKGGEPYVGACRHCGLVFLGHSHYLPERFRPIVDIGDEV